MADKVNKIVEAIKELSVVEAFELKKALEEEFGVTAAAPMAMMAAPTAGAAEPAEEKTEFDVVISDVGPEKIAVIKAVREITGLGLKEAKDLVEGALPITVSQAVSKDDATAAVAKITEAKAKAEMK